MSLDRTRACDILGVSKDASDVDIRTAYKRLALKWHPDKHAKNDQEATQKFQDISAAYKYLTTKGNEDEFVFTMDDMFDLFAQMFFGSRGRYNGFCADSSDDYSDDDDSDDNFWESVNRNSFTKKSTEYSYTANRPSASEASKNAEELMMEEERQKKSREKRKSKKKRQREKKREEKVRKEEEDTQKAAEKKRQEEFLQRAKESAEKAKREAEEARWREAEQARRREAEEARRREAEVRRRQAEIKQAISMSTSTYKGATNSTSTTIQNTLSNGFTSSKSKPKGVSDSKMKNSAKVKMETDNWASSDSDDDITGWDQNSAFFAGAAATINKKMGATAAPVAKSEKNKKKGGAKGQKEKTESIDNMDPIVLQSRQMAVKGNEMAQLDHYSAAIDLFTQAIELDPRDFRFFGNRSFCFDRLQQYEDALKDADRAITLSKDWPKGHFRKGRALAGLKEYGEAENAFVHVLKLDKNCEDAVAELKEVRIARLMEMGFTRPQSDVAIRQFGSVQAALDALLTNGVEGVVNSFSEDVYFSDEEDFITETIESSKLDSRNPLSVTNLWVGNLHSTVSEKQLRDLFAPFGEIISLRRLPDRFCAFINYTRAEEAARALDNLQGAELGGRFLLIKFPDHPITDGQPRTTVLKKTNANKQQGAKAQGQAQAQAQGQGQGAGDANNKVTGPVNGNECYFWRTTGCVYSDRCHYKHLKNAKGADLKPWQQVMYDN